MPRNIQRAIALLTLLLMLVLVAPQSSASAEVTASIRFVSTSGADSGNCTINACRSIQYAVNQSASGDTILVAEGTYTYNPATDVCTTLTTRAIVCVMNKSISISGGYANDWSARNPTTHPTIIDGLNSNRGVAVIGFPATPSLTMEGFTIQNARAIGSVSDKNAIGAGLLAQLASVTLRDMLFTSNIAIGYNVGSGDGGWADGAGIRIQDAPAASLLQRVTLNGNQSLGGSGTERGGVAFGALFIYNSPVTVEDSTFSGNLAQGGNSSGDGDTGYLKADALGGGVAIQNSVVSLARVSVSGNQVIGGNANNSIGTGGGAYGGGIFIENLPGYNTSLTLVDSIVEGNQADAGNAHNGGIAAGGGIDADSCPIYLQRVEVIANTAIGGDSSAGTRAGLGSGGGINLFAIRSGVSRSSLANILIADNYADQGGGDRSDAGNGGGGGMIVQGLGADITHSTFAYNGIGSNLFVGQALIVQPWLNPNLPADATLNHSIIANHTAGADGSAAIHVQNIYGATGALTLNYGLFAGNDVNTINWGTLNGLGTMSTDSTAGFISPGSPQYNYHLRLDSPAKDQASTSSLGVDFDNQARPFNAVRDFGSDEYWSFPLAAGIGNGSLLLDWSQGIAYLGGGVDHYEAIVTCEPGALPPDQGACGTAINAGTGTHFSLTGLSNQKIYTITLFTRDASNAVFASSFTVSATPRDYQTHLPFVTQ